LLFDLLSADKYLQYSTLKKVTGVSCPPFFDENVAALLSFLINTHGQKGDRHLNKSRTYPSGSERSKRGKNERRRSNSQVKKHSSDYFTVAVKSSGDISAEPVRGQKMEEHVVTDLDLRNDENRPSSTSSTVAEERQDV